MTKAEKELAARLAQQSNNAIDNAVVENADDEKELVVTYTLSKAEVEKLNTYIELASSAKRSDVKERATTMQDAISFNLGFGIDEQIRRFEKQVKDSKERHEKESKIAVLDKILSFNGDTAKIAEYLMSLSVKK